MISTLNMGDYMGPNLFKRQWSYGGEYIFSIKVLLNKNYKKYLEITQLVFMLNSKYSIMYHPGAVLPFHHFTNIFLNVSSDKSETLLISLENKVKHYNITKINTLLLFPGKWLW